MAAPQYRGPWLILRLLVLQRDGHICQLNLKGCTHKATQVDHIRGLAQGGPAWDPNNMQSACRSCNVAKGNIDNPRPWQHRRQPSRQW